MADARTPLIIDFEDQGQRVVSYIDVADEAVYGAGNLYLRGRAYTLDEVTKFIQQALDTGSPIEFPATNPLAIERFTKIGRTRFVKDENDPYPNKAQYMLHIHLRVKFYDSFGDIDIGIPWAKLYLGDTNEINPNYPLGDYSMGQTFSMSDLRLLKCCWISTKDACQFLEQIGVSNPKPEPDNATYLVTEQGFNIVRMGDSDTDFLTAER